jgi:UDP-N-acetylglucosamine 2-epimerase (non-hydrolysing)
MVRKAVEPLLENQPRVHLIQPIDYITLAWLLQKTHILITDSGGLQEEGASIGKPTLVLRETTERPEAVEAGVAKLVGTNKENVKNELRLLLADQAAYDKMAKPSSVYGDGKTSEKIVEILKNYFS